MTSEKIKSILGYFCVILCAVISIAVSRPGADNGFFMADATYHVLLTMQALDDSPVHTHYFLPIQTFSADSNKNISFSPLLLQNENGDNFYLSFSPAGFTVPYFFCKLFSLPLTEKSLFVFNSFLRVVCTILLGVLMKILFDKMSAIWAMILYLFTPEVLYSQGIVFWHHSISQCLIILQFILIAKIIHRENNILYSALLFVSFLFPYVEWTGFIANAGIALGILLYNTKRVDGNRFLLIKTRACGIVLLLAFATIGALAVYIFRFCAFFSIRQIMTQMFLRANGRAYAPLKLLFSGYWESLSPLLIAVLVLFIITVLKNRKTVQGFFNKKTVILFFIFCFPVLENFIMRNHACFYSFDRMKAVIPLLFIILFFLNSNSKKIRNLTGWSLCVLCIFISGINYPYDRINFQTSVSQDNETLRDFITTRYENALYVKKGWLAWGYLQTLYHRNFYCTDHGDEIIAALKAKNVNEIVCLAASENRFGDKTRYSNAVAIDLKAKKSSIIHVGTVGFQ